MTTASNRIINKNNITIYGNDNKIYGNDNIIYGHNNNIKGHGNTIVGDYNQYSGIKNKSNGNNQHLWALVGTEKQYLENKQNYGQHIVDINDKKIYNTCAREDEIIIPDPDPNEEIIDNDVDACSICMDRKIMTVIVDCGHRCLCVTCSQMYKNKLNPTCPICRKNVTHIIKTY